MAIMNGFTVTPHHRQNRRRERPGSRTRRTVTRKSNIQLELAEGFIDAYDSNVPLPSDRAHPSPLLRENFHQSWQRWKEREAEERAVVESNRLQIEREQQRLYGGDPSDDELYRMGILYDNVRDIAQDETVVCEGPLEQPSPLCIQRHRKSRRNRRRATRWSIPLHLSHSNLRDDADIAQLLSISPLTTNTKLPIKYPESITPLRPSALSIPQSLPLATDPALKDFLHSSLVDFLGNVSIPPTPNENYISDWEFITINTDTTIQTVTPSSEPETWILLGDDS